MLQHIIFVVARVPIFLIYSILTCCCDKGRDLDDDAAFEDRIISFDFIPYELGVLRNFENHPRGIDEVAFNRELAVIRHQQQEVMQPQAPGMNQSQIARLAGGLRKTVVGKMAQSVWKGAECSICLIEFEPGMKVYQLACHKTHLFHDECYLAYLKQKEGQQALCPVCRTPIDKEKAIKIEIEETKTPKVDDVDPFSEVANPKPQNDDVVISAPVAINANPDEAEGEVPMVMAPGGDGDDLPPPQ